MDKVTRITIAELERREGRKRLDMAMAVTLSDENAPALCTEGCEVEPDGVCTHGNPSLLLEMGII